jgi:hypothetical protein
MMSEQQEKSGAEHESQSLAHQFGQQCTSARYNVFQLIEVHTDRSVTVIHRAH